jgi:hypothetical protein
VVFVGTLVRTVRRVLIVGALTVFVWLFGGAVAIAATAIEY